MGKLIIAGMDKVVQGHSLRHQEVEDTCLLIEVKPFNRNEVLAIHKPRI